MHGAILKGMKDKVDTFMHTPSDVGGLCDARHSAAVDSFILIQGAIHN